MTRLGRFVVRHRRLVGLLWLVALLAGGATAGRTVDRLTFDFSLPGQAGYEAERELLDVYGNGGTQAPLLPVVTVPDGTTVAERADDVAAVFARLRAAF